MQLKEDLRAISEQEFKEIFNHLKQKTDNFTTISPELILENNQYLLILRLCSGLSQESFAKYLGTTKDWCRHTEAGRNKIKHLAIAKRYNKQLEILLRDNLPTMENTVKKFKIYKFSREQDLPKPEIELKQISKLTEENVKEYFNLIKKETNNFKEFKQDLLSRIPQAILIFRIVLCINHRKFAKILDIDSRSIRYYESASRIMKKSRSIELIKKIEILFKGYIDEISLNQTIENFRILTNFYGNRNLDHLINQGLTNIGFIGENKYEEEILDILKRNNINYTRFALIEGINRKYNIDFLINNKNKKIILEVFSYNNKKRSDIKTKVCVIDHRFQILKNKNPSIKTMMCIQTKGKPILKSYVRKYLEMETMNTDYMLINEEELIPKIIKEI
ncbi:MAG: hypothetical protein AABX29_06035 [Nanoarchaeota archaeon]